MVYALFRPSLVIGYLGLLVLGRSNIIGDTLVYHVLYWGSQLLGRFFTLYPSAVTISHILWLEQAIWENCLAQHHGRHKGEETLQLVGERLSDCTTPQTPQIILQKVQLEFSSLLTQCILLCMWIRLRCAEGVIWFVNPTTFNIIVDILALVHSE